MNFRGGILKGGRFRGGLLSATYGYEDTSYSAKIPRNGARSLDEIILDDGGMRGFWVLGEAIYGVGRLL